MDIPSLLSKIDYASVFAAVLTFALGYLAKHGAYKKVLDTLGDIADLVSDYTKAQADGKISSEETTELIDDIRHIVSDYKK